MAQIMQAIDSKQLRVIRDDPMNQDRRYWRIQRKDLQRYFKELGEAPEFLKD